MKRYIVLFCILVILLGSVANGWATTPPKMPAQDYVVSQPSGEKFTVNIPVSSALKPPFPTGTSLSMDISLREDGDDPNLFPSTAHYTVYLAEDGYWYFAKCVQVIYKTGDHGDYYEHVTVYQEGDSITYYDLRNGRHEEIYAPCGPNARVMIDPLPDEVYDLGYRGGPFDLRQTTQKEKAIMAKMIAAERERLAPLRTSTEIEDPGPDAFIIEPEETVDDRIEQATVETSAPDTAVVTSVEETEPSSSDSFASAPAASVPSETAAISEQTPNRSWLSACLIGGGVVVVLSGGIVAGLLIWRKKKNVVK